MSVLVRVDCTPARLPLLALVAGLAARDAIAIAAPTADVRTKWPNDVVVGADRKKIAGVLVEAILQGRTVEALVVGIGINVHTRHFPDDLRGSRRATSLSLLERRAAPSRPTAERSSPTSSPRSIATSSSSRRAASGSCTPASPEADALRGASVVSDAKEAGEGSPRASTSTDACSSAATRGSLARWGAGEVHLARAGRSAKPTRYCASQMIVSAAPVEERPG